MENPEVIIDDGIDGETADARAAKVWLDAIKARCGDRVITGRIPETVKYKKPLPDWLKHCFWVADQQYCPVCGGLLSFVFSWDLIHGHGHCTICYAGFQHYFYLTDVHDPNPECLIAWAIESVPTEPWEGEYAQRFA